MFLYTDLLHKIEFEAGVSSTVCLSRSERLVAREILIETEAQIAQLENGLLKERLLLERLYIALAPHKLLPLEVIVEIFLYTITGEAISIPHSKSCLDMSPWVLQQICAPWRIIALEQPQLWNNFHLRVDSLGRLSLSGAQLFLQFFCHEILHHTGPIRIKGGEQLPRHFAPLMRSEIIMPNIDRFLELSLTNNGAINLDEYLPFPGSFFGALEFLTVSSHSFSDFLTASKPLPLFDGLKSLRRISFMGSVNEISVSPNIPWHQLTWVDLMPNIDSWFTISILTSATVLRQCESLVTLCIGVNTSKEDIGAHSIPAIHLPHLRDLTLSSQDPIEELRHVESPSLLDYIHAPSLTRLDLCVGYDTDRQLCVAICSLIIRSCCGLEELALRDGHRDSENPELPKLLALLSHMRSMKTECLYYTDSTLRSIARGEILPRLERWCFHGGVGSIHLFQEIVKTRRRRRTDASEQDPQNSFLGVLEVAEMYASYECDPVLSQWQKKLKEYGSQFHLHHPSLY